MYQTLLTPRDWPQNYLITYMHPPPRAKCLQFLRLYISRATTARYHGIGCFYDVRMSHSRECPTTFPFHTDAPLPVGVVRVQEYASGSEIDDYPNSGEHILPRLQSRFTLGRFQKVNKW